MRLRLARTLSRRGAARYMMVSARSIMESSLTGLNPASLRYDSES